MNAAAGRGNPPRALEGSMRLASLFLIVSSLAGLAMGCSTPTGSETDSGVPHDGAPDDGASTLDDAGPRDAGPRPDTGPRPDAGPIEACTGLAGVTLTNVVAALHPDAGVVHPGTRTLVSLPQAISPSLTGIATVVIEDDTLTVATLPVTTEAAIGGQVFATVWSPSLDRMISSVYVSGPFRYELLATEVRADGATIRALTSINPPASDGSIIGPLYALGSTIVAMRGDSFLTVTVDLGAGTATWSDPTALDTTNMPLAQTSDPAHGRLVGYGITRFTPPMTISIDPGLATRSLPSGPWSTMAASGSPPPSTGFMGGFTGWVAYEEMSDRLFVVVYHTITGGPFGDHMSPGLWSVSLTTGAFTQHVDEYYDGQTLYDRPYAMDVVARRTIEPSYRGVTVRSLAVGTEGDILPIAQDGVLPPTYVEASARLGDGRLVMLVGDQLVTLDPAETHPRWTRLGTLSVPRDHQFAPVLAHDPVGGRLLITGGAPSSSETPTTFLVSAVAEDGTTLATLTTTGTPPPARARHSAIVVGNELLVVGGLALGFAGGTVNPALDDVWALDLTTLAWRRVGTLPGGRAAPALRARPDGTVWVIGGYDSTEFVGVPSVVSIDPATGTTSSIATPGAWPPGDGVLSAWTTLGEGILGIDLGGTVDWSGGQLWQLVPDDGGSRTGSAATRARVTTRSTASSACRTRGTKAGWRAPTPGTRSSDRALSTRRARWRPIDVCSSRPERSSISSSRRSSASSRSWSACARARSSRSRRVDTAGSCSRGRGSSGSAWRSRRSASSRR